MKGDGKHGEYAQMRIGENGSESGKFQKKRGPS